MNWLPEFVDAYRSKRLIFFAGSGISYASGLPSADQIVRRTARAVLSNTDNDKLLSPLLQIQPELFYESLIAISGDRRCLGIWAALHRATQIHYGIRCTYNSVHEVLVNYSHTAGVPVVTTNFDTMFEDAAKALGIRYRVYRPHDLPPIISAVTANILPICKIHGSVETESGKFDASALWTTATEISTFNRPWITYLEEIARQFNFCFVGYSGRDIDIFPHLAKAAGAGSKQSYWIDRCKADEPAEINAKKASAHLLRTWPSVLFAKMGLCGPITEISSSVSAGMLDKLEKDLCKTKLLSSGQQKLFLSFLASRIHGANQAFELVNSITPTEYHSFAPRIKAEYHLAMARCHHEQAKYISLGRAGLKTALVALREPEYLMHGLIAHCESLRMRIPADSYYPDSSPLALLLRLLVIGQSILVAALVLATTLITRKSLADLSPHIRHAVIEHFIRFLAIIQRLLGSLASKNGSYPHRFLITAWKRVYQISHKHGYAAGMGNAFKFLFRIAPQEIQGHDTAKEIFGLFSDKTGLELLRRNEADLALSRGEFSNALDGYHAYYEMAKSNGNVLSQVKGLLGIFHTRKSTHETPFLFESELHAFQNLAAKIEGLLWRRHLAMIEKRIIATFQIKPDSDGIRPGLFSTIDL